MSEPNIRLWRKNIKEIVTAEYPDARVTVKSNGDVFMRNPSTGTETFEGNLNDTDVCKQWSRYRVEELDANLVGTVWYCQTKDAAVAVAAKCIQEGATGQINIVDRGVTPCCIARIAADQKTHRIHVIPGMFNRQQANDLKSAQWRSIVNYTRISYKEVNQL